MYCRWKIGENADSDTMRCKDKRDRALEEEAARRPRAGRASPLFPLVPESQFSRPRRPHSFDPTAWSLAKKSLVVSYRDTYSFSLLPDS